MDRTLIILFILILILTGCTLQTVSQPAHLATVGPSPTPTIKPTLTLSPTPLPTTTPVPAARILSGKKDVLNGDYSKARIEFQSLLSSTTDGDVRGAALWGLGQVEFISGDYPAALENLRALTQNYPTTDEGIHGWFLLGETYFSLNRYQEAADAYQNYLIARPGLLDAYIQNKRGNALSSIDDQSGAQRAYREAEIAPGQTNPLGIRISIANTYLNSGDPETALKIFDEIFASASNDYLKAQMDLLSGRAMLALGRTDDGYDRWRHAVDNFPLAYDSYSALLGLVEANQPVDQFNRGLVDFYAQKYDVALRAFRQYISENPNHDGTVLHFMALTLREMGDYNSAIDLWNIIIDKYSGNRYWDSAWDEKAYTQWAYLNDYRDAAEGLEKFASKTVDSPFAITYLLEAARIYERSGDLDKAAQLWESLPDRFGSDPLMNNAWFQAGIVRYRTKNYSKANNDFQQSLLLSKEPSDRARALLWIGKTYALLGDKEKTNSSWEQARVSDPTGYYSVRSRDLQENREPFAAPPVTTSVFDIVRERAEAAAWIRIKFNLPSDTDLSNPGKLQSDLRFKRGLEFWNLGLFDEARMEFENLRESLKADAADSFRLGNFLLEIGLYRPAISAIREVLTLAGMDNQADSLTAPIYFSHVRYGFYYKEIIWPAAEDNKFNPLFITSVIRQESLFEGFVRSNKEARGLMQIIPLTGESIASQMGWPPDYNSDLLYSPYISIKMGTYYLNSCRRVANGDYYTTLAAYNSGPGNASIWQGLANGDPDLELEIIRYSEPRDYIRSIYEIYTIYRGLYSPMR